MKSLHTISLTVALSVTAWGAAQGSDLEIIGVPAQILDVAKETTTQSHGTTDFSCGARTATTTWRMVKDTGNCCENHITTSSDGRLFDIAGSFVNFTDDRGLTWKSVRPLDPLVNAEGSVAVAPNGDIIAMTWDHVRRAAARSKRCDDRRRLVGDGG